MEHLLIKSRHCGSFSLFSIIMRVDCNPQSSPVPVPNLSAAEPVLISGRDRVSPRFFDLAAIFWWSFVAVAGLFALAVIALNLHYGKAGGE
jgi:hypothetical protein